MRFSKLHGLGNDFILMENQPTTDEAKLGLLARLLCHRHFGVGADGLILVLPGDKAPFKMRIINSDGSEAEMCGNGIRCFAKYVYERGLTKETEFEIETLAGIIRPRLMLASGKVTEVCVDMGQPRLNAADIPVVGYGDGPVVKAKLTVDNTDFQFTAVSMGNPHIVIAVKDLENIPWQELGPKMEQHPAFPKKVNVEFVQQVGEDRLRVKVWERGAGPTLACGTGACAVAVASSLTGLVDRRATIELPGGELAIKWGSDDHVYMTGPATHVFSGELQPEIIEAIQA
ncbi:MAG: diaminopimelate epimerase [bacterium]